MSQKGFTLIEILAVLSVFSALTILVSMQLTNRIERGELEVSIQQARAIAKQVNELRRRPTSTVRQANDQVTLLFGNNTNSSELTIEDFNTQFNTRFDTRSSFDTPFRVKTTPYTTVVIFNVPFEDANPVEASVRKLTNLTTDVSIIEQVSSHAAQNKRVKWVKRVLYQEQTR